MTLATGRSPKLEGHRDNAPEMDRLADPLSRPTLRGTLDERGTSVARKGRGRSELNRRNQGAVALRESAALGAESYPVPESR
jgi:hypothetical protein